ncbi:MAG: winged helix-turn-helix domain-containing protein [Phocaeicola plebeius]|nr:winged helix-turn-helix domain-containing protein [Phocaeicola plebeius]
MDKHQIGTNAGIVWNVLKDNSHWEYHDLKNATGLSDRDLNAAIGWLARENKVDFDLDHCQDRLFLSVNVYIG